tara:strand:+ start:2550 stop:2897 length:348 start_codon:yes stop_codon:yes gene_type:complete
MKSEICFGKVSGEPLTEYYSEHEALDAAEYSEIQFGHELVPYNCRKCGQWHLSPKSRQTPTKTCEFCTAADSSFKESYKTKVDAKMRAKIIRDERGIHLAVYQCIHGNGWHLTKG